MSDPQEPIKLLATPTRGSDVGTWDTPVNADFTAIGAMLGGFTTVSLTNAPVTLTAPSGTPTPGGGPTQSQNSLIIFSGTLSGNCTVTIPLPGAYNILNNCVVGAFYVQLSCGAGNKIGVPPGQMITVFANGTDMQFISLPPPGSYWDYAGSTVPAWIGACTVAPWKPCDGSILNIADWPQLYAIIGSAYGGNGLTTFAVPDLRNRVRVPIDTNQGGFTNRVTASGSGISGQSLGAAGGDQLMQQHTHAAAVTDPGHLHQITGQTPATGAPGLPTLAATGTPFTRQTDPATTGITVSNANTGSGASQNMQPSLISGLAFIKT